MEFPKELKYAKEHTWVRVNGSQATVGISDHAQSELGDIMFVDLPEVGAEVKAHASFGNVESVKTVSELFAPVSGKVSKVNSDLGEGPEVVNAKPYEDGWMVEIEMSDPSELDGLLSAEAYSAYTNEEKG